MAARRAKSFLPLDGNDPRKRWLRSKRASMQVISTGVAGAAGAAGATGAAGAAKKSREADQLSC